MMEIAILDTGYESYEYEQKLCREQGFELVIHKGPRSEHQLKFETARNAVGILVRLTPIGSKELAMMPNLKAIVRYGVGYDNIDISAAKLRGIKVANVQGYGNHSVSDHAMALMFACIRNLEESRKGPFGKPTRLDIFELHNKVLGIIGIGRIGSQFARKASPLFRKILAYDPYQSVETIHGFGAEKTEFEHVLKESHVISLHCNLTHETRHLLSKDRFCQMKQRPVIINTARGAVIHEGDLMEALQNDLIHSAGLDVYEKEPPGEIQIKIMDHPRVTATQHIAWYSDQSIQELQKRAADNLIGLLKGDKIEDEL